MTHNLKRLVVDVSRASNHNQTSKEASLRGETLCAEESTILWTGAHINRYAAVQSARQLTPQDQNK